MHTRIPATIYVILGSVLMIGVFLGSTTMLLSIRAVCVP